MKIKHIPLIALVALAPSIAFAQSNAKTGLSFTAGTHDSSGETATSLDVSVASEFQVGPATRADVYASFGNASDGDSTLTTTEVGATIAFAVSDSASVGLYFDAIGASFDDSPTFNVNAVGVEARLNVSDNGYVSVYAGTLTGGDLPSDADTSSFGLRGEFGLSEKLTLTAAYQGEDLDGFNQSTAAVAVRMQMSDTFHLEAGVGNHSGEGSGDVSSVFIGGKIAIGGKSLPRALQSDHIILFGF